MYQADDKTADCPSCSAPVPKPEDPIHNGDEHECEQCKATLHVITDHDGQWGLSLKPFPEGT